MCLLVGWFVCWSVGWSVDHQSVGRSVGWLACHNFLKGHGSYTSMILLENMFFFYFTYCNNLAGLIEDNGGRHGGHWPLPREDEVVWRRLQVVGTHWQLTDNSSIS